MKFGVSCPVRVGLAIGLFLSLGFWQQCSDVRLFPPGFSTTFQSKGFPHRLYPPTEFPIYKRYVILVDVSNSMISGPCPFDVGNAPRFHVDQPYFEYDPNKPSLGYDPNDGRGVARDCRVDSSLPIDVGSETAPDVDFAQLPHSNYSTYMGSDFEGDRFKVIRQWIDELRQNLSPQMKARAKFMIIPISGGKAQLEIDTDMPKQPELYELNSPLIDLTMDYLESVQEKDLLHVQSPDFDRWLHTVMGTTAPSSKLDDIYREIRADMEDLNDQGALSFANYEIYHFSDGLVRPLEKDFEDVLNLHPLCAACSGNFENCTGICTELINDMKLNWGDPKANTTEVLDFKFSIIDALPKYYGSGLITTNFVQLKPDRILASRPNDPNMFTQLKEKFKERSAKVRIWNMPDERPPVRLVPIGEQLSSYKMTHLYVMNTNARLNKNSQLEPDSDGDGLFDSEEISLGFSITDPRSNGYCLDSLTANEVFKDRCNSLAISSGCNPTLDSDGDSLNECEEMIIGTDPFDFDTDGDTLPDSLEWIYGYNPNASDLEVDTNGDGHSNLVQFAAGLGPNHYFDQTPLHLRNDYSVDHKGSEIIQDFELGAVRVELNEVKLNSVISTPTQSVSKDTVGDMFAGRLTFDNSNFNRVYIPFNHRLINHTDEEDKNRVLVLARIVDPRQPEIVFWRILKFNTYEHNRGIGIVLDLSAFQQIRAVDQNLSGEI